VCTGKHTHIKREVLTKNVRKKGNAQTKGLKKNCAGNGRNQHNPQGGQSALTGYIATLPLF